MSTPTGGRNLDTEEHHRARLQDLDIVIKQLAKDIEKIDQRNERVDEKRSTHYKDVSRIETNLLNLKNENEKQFEEIKEDVKALTMEMHGYVNQMKGFAIFSRLLMWVTGVSLTFAGVMAAWMKIR